MKYCFWRPDLAGVHHRFLVILLLTVGVQRLDDLERVVFERLGDLLGECGGGAGGDGVEPAAHHVLCLVAVEVDVKVRKVAQDARHIDTRHRLHGARRFGELALLRVVALHQVVGAERRTRKPLDLVSDKQSAADDHRHQTGDDRKRNNDISHSLTLLSECPARPDSLGQQATGRRSSARWRSAPWGTR